MAEFNFNKINIPTMKVVLNDEEQTVLHIKTPETYVVKNIIECQKYLADAEEIESYDEAIDNILNVVSVILSNNKEHIKIEANQLLSLGIGVDEIALLFAAYLDFINENTPKN